MAWTQRPALFYEKHCTVFDLLWESSGLRALLLPVRKLCWQTGDAIKASITASRYRRVSYIAAAEMDDKAERSALADNYGATYDETDRGPRDATQLPASPQQNLLAFRKNLGTVLSLLRESCSLETILLPLRKLRWKVIDTIKASIAAASCQEDSNHAAAEVDGEVERTAPADNCVATEGEAATRVNDLVPQGETLLPASEQEIELALQKNVGTVFARLPEACGLGTVLLSARKLSWKISDAIKASITATRRLEDSKSATAEVDDEVDRSTPANNCVATEGEAMARANDWVPKDVTPVPAPQQQNELGFWRNLRTVLASLWEPCGLGTLLLSVRELFWKISDVIKASTKASPCKCGRYIAAAKTDGEVERSAPADYCVATKGAETARDHGRAPRGATPVPAAQQHNELTFQGKRYRSVRPKDRRDNRLGTLWQCPEECLQDNQARNTRRRRGQSTNPFGKSENLRKQTGGPSKAVTRDIRGVSPSEVRTMLDSCTSCDALSEFGDVSDCAAMRDCKLTHTELLRDKEALRPQAVHGRKKRGASLRPKVREPSKPQADAASVARKATSIASHTKMHPSSSAATIREIAEPFCPKSRVRARPRKTVTGKASALLSAKTKARKLISSMETPSSSSDTSKLETKLARSRSRRVETKRYPLPNTRSERKPRLLRPPYKLSQSDFTLVEEKQRLPSRRDCFLESSHDRALPSRAGNSGGRTSSRDVKGNKGSRHVSREVQKSSEFTDDNVSVSEASSRSEKPLHQRQPKRWDRSEAGRHSRMSRSTAIMQSRNSQNEGPKAAPGTGSSRATSDTKTTKVTKPRRAPDAAPRSRPDRRLRRRNVSERRRGPATKRLTGTSLENHSVLTGVAEEPRSLKSQRSSRMPSTMSKCTERHKSESTLKGPPPEGVSRKSRSGGAPASNRIATRCSKQGKNFSSSLSNAFESTPLASKVAICATSECSTGRDTQADKAIAEKQRRRRWRSKYSAHEHESWKEWCKKRESGFSNGSMVSTATNSSANCKKLSSREGTGTSQTSAASGTGEQTHASDEKPPAEPLARTRPPNPLYEP